MIKKSKYGSNFKIRIFTEKKENIKEFILSNDKINTDFISKITKILLPEINNLLTDSRRMGLSSLKTKKIPTKRFEEYRFTDLRPFNCSDLVLPTSITSDSLKKHLEHLSISQVETPYAVIIDGVFSPQHSSLQNIPRGMYVGSFASLKSSSIGADCFSDYDTMVSSSGGFFASLNSATTKDPFCIIMNPNTTLIHQPLHLIIISSNLNEDSKTTNYSAPRIYIRIAEEAHLKVIEEYVSLGAGPKITNSVMECLMSKGAKIIHQYIQTEVSNHTCSHFKSTIVNQTEKSHYSCTEIRIGGGTNRHDLILNQLGSNTITNMKHLILASENQMQDLHSKVTLDFPKSVLNQLHKCIVAHSTGQGVFDGNVKVNQMASKTNAQQISRNLLLNQRSSVYVKPNLQIIAEDVRCTHGCTVSELDESLTLYLALRGINKKTAQQALICSFGLEIINCLGNTDIRTRVEEALFFTLKNLSFNNI
jgi:Fe-S cluster assembly protein SufD